MKQFIKSHIEAELSMVPPEKSRGLEFWYEQNKAVVWLVGIGVALLGLLVKLS